MDINGKTAVITGGGSGIGRATAQRLAAAGAAIVIADLDTAMGEGSVGLIEAKGGRAVFIKTDVNDPEQVRKMCDWHFRNSGTLTSCTTTPESRLDRLGFRAYRSSNGGA